MGERKSLINIFLKKITALTISKDSVIPFHILFIQTSFKKNALSHVKQFFIKYNPQCSLLKCFKEKIKWVLDI